MPLDILIILVVGGIAGIAGVLHALGLSRAAALDEAAALREWERHFPDDLVERVVLARNGTAALIHSSSGRGLLWRFGADTVARSLPCADLTDHPKGLKLHFVDFAAPSVVLKLTPDERAQWKKEIAQS